MIPAKATVKKIKQLYYVSENTFIHLLQGKILINTLFITIGLFAITYVATKFTFGVPQKIALDIGLSLLSISSLVISLSLGTGLISREIESRTLYVILARSVPREVFLLGKILGLVAILLLNIFILSTATLGLYYLLGGEIDSLIFWCILFIGLEATLVLLISVFFSLITNKALNVMLTIIIWILGYIAFSIISSPMVDTVPYLREVLNIYVYFFPAFYKLNLKDLVIYEQTISTGYLFSAINYFVLYSLGLLALSSLVFKNKNLD